MIRRQAAEEGVDILGLELQDFFELPSFYQFTHYAGTYNGIDATFWEASDVLDDAVFYLYLHRQRVPAAAHAHGQAVCGFESPHVPGVLGVGQKNMADGFHRGFRRPFIGEPAFEFQF
jgi:hypothetical protein